MNPVKIIEIYKKFVMILIGVLLCLFLFLFFNLINRDRDWNNTVEAMAEADMASPTATYFPSLTPTLTVTPFEPATHTPTPTITATPTITPTPQTINPLTGLPVADPALLERRPVMIKVSNWPATGRPHAGLSNADIVFEYYIGYAKSRFLALYYSEDAAKIGPVRSGRMVDPQLVNLYGGIFGYGNADPKVDAVIFPALGERALPFKYLPCPPMCGVDTHAATGVFADSAAMTEYAIQKGLNNDRPDLSGMTFNLNPPETGVPGQSVTFWFASWSMTQWRYDAASQQYLWWMESNQNGEITLEPMPDRNTGQQIAFDNIIVITAQYIEYAPTLHDVRVSAISAPQEAYFFRDGQMVEGTWHVADPNAPMVFQNLDGSPYALKPGKTWIFIAGQNSAFTLDETGNAFFEFHIP